MQTHRGLEHVTCESKTLITSRPNKRRLQEPPDIPFLSLPGIPSPISKQDIFAFMTRL